MMLSAYRVSAVLLLIFAVLLVEQSLAAPPTKKGAAKSPVEERAAKMQTAPSDTLLYRLEEDYVKLLAISSKADRILEAEQLLQATNDSTTWTNYSLATKLLLNHRDNAAIPLLFRYMVIHSKRSAANAMLPEYVATLKLLTGCDFDPYFNDLVVSTLELDATVRAKVEQVLAKWWMPNERELDVSLSRWSESQLANIVDHLIKRLQHSELVSRSGVENQLAYQVNNIMSYGMFTKGVDGSVLHFSEPRLTMLFLDRFRPGNDKPTESPSTSTFLWEAIPYLAALRKEGAAEQLDEIAADPSQPNRVRLASLLALQVANIPLDTKLVLELLAKETRDEDHVIEVAALRYGDESAVPLLLQNLKHPNREFALAAIYSLQRWKPSEALDILEKRVETITDLYEVIAVANYLGEYKNRRSQLILRKWLEATLPRKDENALSRILAAFETCCGQRWLKPGANNNDYDVQARVAIAWYKDFEVENAEKLKNRRLAIASQREQIEKVQTIEKMRHAELKRLLGLQADGIVTNSKSMAAESLWTATKAELEQLKQELRTLEAEAAQLELDWE